MTLGRQKEVGGQGPEGFVKGNSIKAGKGSRKMIPWPEKVPSDWRDAVGQWSFFLVLFFIKC